MAKAASNVMKAESRNGDDGVLDRACSGDVDAFQLLVAQYQDRIYNMILRIVDIADDAADLTQETFLSAYAKITSFRRRSGFYTWLYRIAINGAMSHLRQRADAREIADPPGTAEQRPSGSDAPSAGLEREERAREVRRALSAIDDDYRAVVVLRDVEDLSYREISLILKIPQGTVKSRLYRGREALRERLGEALR